MYLESICVFYYHVSLCATCVKSSYNNNNNNNNNNIYLLKLCCYPVAVVILHVNKT